MKDSRDPISIEDPEADRTYLTQGPNRLYLGNENGRYSGDSTGRLTLQEKLARAAASLSAERRKEAKNMYYAGEQALKEPATKAGKEFRRVRLSPLPEEEAEMKIKQEKRRNMSTIEKN